VQDHSCELVGEVSHALARREEMQREKMWREREREREMWRDGRNEEGED
jgi:hypothetical protein